MRKVDPADVRADFESASKDIVEYFNRVVAVVAVSPSKERDTSQLATQSFLALFVAFERFISDLVLAYLNRDFSVFQAALHARVSSSVRERFGDGVHSLLSLKTHAHVRMTDLEAIVDPTGWNLTFPSIEKLKSFASNSLAAAHAARITSISVSEARLIETARAVRNFVAHQSVGSKKLMNDALSTVEVGNHNRHLGRGVNEVHTVGSYLKAVHAGQRRLHRYSIGLLAISSHM